MADRDPFYGPEGDDEGMPDVGQEDHEEDAMEPAMLEVTEKKVQQAFVDRASLRGQSCVLCDVAFVRDLNVQNKLSEIWDYYDYNRRRMLPEILYKAISERYNKEILKRRRERIQGDENAPELTVTMVRRHFEDNHDRTPLSMLEDRLDYLARATEEMERSSLWLRKRNDPDGHLSLKTRDMDVYLRMTSHIATIVQRLGIEGRESSYGSSRAGKNFH
jgi:hypothetical protein